MARLTVEDCLPHVDNRFHLVLVASKRARQIAMGADALVEIDNDKPTVLALREIADGLVNPDILNEKTEEDRESNLIRPLLNAPIGEDPWWNVSYQWRQCINITNPGTYNLTDNFMSIQFDYATLRDNYNMDPNLYDVRIVENNVVRNYYVKKDFPRVDYATIWFETNSTAGESEYDTFMYWGNASINYRGSKHVDFDPSGTAWWSFEEGMGLGVIILFMIQIVP